MSPHGQTPGAGTGPGEMVMAVPAASLAGLLPRAGFSRQAPGLAEAIQQHAVFLARQRAEADPQYKQIIALAILLSGSRVFRYQRAEEAEPRLKGRWTLAVGGHVHPADAEPGPAIQAALRRELAEEIGLTPLQPPLLAGVVNDDGDAVGKVHLGMVHVLRVDPALVRPRCSGLARAGFEEIAALRARQADFENWSALLLSDFFPPDYSSSFI